MFGSGTAAGVIKSFSAKLPKGIAQRHLGCCWQQQMYASHHIPSISWHSRRPSIMLKIFVSSQADNLFHLDSQDMSAIPLQTQTQTAEREGGIPIKQATHVTRLAYLFKVTKSSQTLISIVDKPPLLSDVDDSLESMSDPEEDEMHNDNDNDSSCSANGYGDGEMRKDNEEDSSSNFFASGEGAIIPDCLSLCVASESGQSGRGSGTEDDPVSPEIPTAAHDPT
ncbi:hypothetical protein V8E53_007419 [Lactarius tabidus]